MPCYHPITAYQAEPGTPLLFADAKWGMTNRGGGYHQLQIACGQCRGCKLKRSREWAMRCIHEKQMHKYSSYITLTFNNENLGGYNLEHEHFQRFMKRTRKALGKMVDGKWVPSNTDTLLHGRHGDSPHTPGEIKFYMCGEYGPLHGRPHYHALLFGVDFRDRQYLRTTPAGAKIYRSPQLEKLWTHGYSSVGELTFESAAYIARYVMKKRTGDGNKNNYEILDPETGEIVIRKKEYNQMSRRSGIGKTWIEKYKTDVYTTGKVIVRGHPNNPPRYYDKIYKELDQAQLEHIQYARYIEALAQHEHRTPERLAVQEEVQEARTRSLKRGNLDGS